MDGQSSACHPLQAHLVLESHLPFRLILYWIRLGVDRNWFLAQSVCGVLMPLTPSPMKKGLFIMVAVVLAPVLLVGVVALAAGDWQQVGATAAGDQVLVSSVTARKNGLRTAWIRVEYKEPTKMTQGGP